MLTSAARNGRPLARAKPCWGSARLARRPAVHRAASWTNCKAKRGSTRSAAWPLQPHNRSHVPRRRCSGSNSHSPRWAPLNLSASSCRTPRSRLRGSAASPRVWSRPLTTTNGGSAVGPQRWSFFLKAVVSDDAFDAARTDDPAGLAELLGDDVGGGVGVEEAVADDLADDFVGAAVATFGAAFLAEQGGAAAVGERLAELEVALLREAELACGGGGAEALAFAFDEHGEFAGDLVVGAEGEGAGGADEEQLLEIDVEHGGHLHREGSKENRCREDNGGRP